MQAERMFQAVGLPWQHLQYTNKCYASNADFAALGGQADELLHVDIKDCIFIVESHPEMQQGSLAMNKVQREFARIGLNQNVSVKKFDTRKVYNLASISMEVDFMFKPASDQAKVEIEELQLEEIVKTAFLQQCLAVNQKIALDFEGKLLKAVVTDVAGLDLGDGEPVPTMFRGMLNPLTDLCLRQGSSGKLSVRSTKTKQQNIFRPDFNFENMGIGGLAKEFCDIFRRAFASRIFPPRVVSDLGINHVKGMLLYGPPGTGKTLLARQIAKFLKAREPKIVNGPEILNRYVGSSEANIRKLFMDAEMEYEREGDNSQLHIVIFDEIDAICKARGSSGDSTGVSDSIVNQLLSKIDGVNALNNILIIGMTNRLDLIDEALLRPGRLEVHCEIHLPKEEGRMEILNIHTSKAQNCGYLAADVSIPALATKTKNFSGAEIEGLVRSATSYAFNRKVDVKNINNAVQEIGDVRITAADFEEALLEVKPAFGLHEDDFAHCIRQGIIPFSTEFEKLQATLWSLKDHILNSSNTPLLSILLAGRPGCGSTSLAADLAKRSDFSYVRLVSAENFVGLSEQSKVQLIQKVFEDAYKSSLSLIVLDGLERLLDYVRIGPRFSNVILQGLFNLIKKPPPVSGRKLFVVATTADLAFIKETSLLEVFSVTLQVPYLSKPEHFKVVLQRQPTAFDAAEIAAICSKLHGQSIGIQKVLLAMDMAIQRQNPIKTDTFLECLQHLGAFDFEIQAEKI